MRAKIIDRWQEVEKTLTNIPPQTQQRVGYTPKEVVEFAGALAIALNVEGSGKLNLIRVSLEATGHGALTGALPSYAIDAPKGSTTGSSEQTAALTTLLKKHGIPITTTKANSLLAQAGLINLVERPSTKSPDETRQFWSVTDKGLAFGKNVTNEKNPRETQPHWYATKFIELCQLAGLLRVL